MPPPPSDNYPRLRKLNLLLTVCTVFVGLYLAISPIVPAVLFIIKDKRTAASAPYGGKLDEALRSVDATATANPQPQGIPTTNQLVIPGIFLNEPILEGDTIATANNGAWRRPTSSRPDIGGNTVIVGHRWTYRAARDVFFHLDKVKVGDPIAVYWQQKEYLYKVSSVSVVLPHEVWVEEQTNTPTLTLYTCTPVWSSRQRLVIRAELQP